MKKTVAFLLFFCFFIGNLRFIYSNNLYCSATNANVDAESMMTIEADSGRILYEKNSTKKLPMASTTKIITAIVAIENCDDLDKKYLISKNMTGIEGSSIYLKDGEHLTIRELLYGLMLRSGNDAAVAIANIISGSTEKFVELMNSFCSRHNFLDTHIVTVNGLHDKQHYTTAKDLAFISSYAIKNSTFRQIVKTKQMKIDNEKDTKNKCRILKNKNRLLNMLDGANGIKTGYTSAAGRCFVGSATRGEMQVICVVLNSRPMFEESSRLINKAFEEYSMTKLFGAGKIKNYSGASVSEKFYIKNDISYPLKKDELQLIKAKANIFDSASSDGQVGRLDFLIKNDLIFSEKIYTIEEEKIGKSNDLKNRINRVIHCF